MAKHDGGEIQAKEKQEATPSVEQTRPGRTFVPAVDIFETEKAITLIADMPGVSSESLDIDLRENILTLAGEVENPQPKTETDLMREYYTGKYFRQFTLSEVIDQAKIDAKLTDGVLRLDLPKVEKAKPRKITVQAT
jgi:HSP20 family molecular chaperone IbpA